MVNQFRNLTVFFKIRIFCSVVRKINDYLLFHVTVLYSRQRYLETKEGTLVSFTFARIGWFLRNSINYIKEF